MRKNQFYLYLSAEEQRVIAQSLVRLKNSLARQGRYTDSVDELILKVMDAPVKKIKIT